MILTGAQVWIHTAKPNALARELLVEDGIIQTVALSDQLSHDPPVRTDIVRLDGGLLLPAFFDGHIHLEQGGKSLMNVQLHDIMDSSRVLSELADRTRDNPDKWTIALGLHEEAWPALRDFNRVTDSAPVLVYTRDYHTAILNHIAMKNLNVSSRTMVPDGGWLEYDSNGTPSGVFHENAISWIEELLPDETIENRKDCLLYTSDAADE